MRPSRPSRSPSKTTSSARQAKASARPRSFKPFLEALEGRLAPAALDLVTSVADDNSGATINGVLQGTLRYVINHAGANDTIHFQGIKGQTIILTGDQI